MTFISKQLVLKLELSETLIYCVAVIQKNAANGKRFVS